MNNINVCMLIKDPTLRKKAWKILEHGESRREAAKNVQHYYGVGKCKKWIPPWHLKRIESCMRGMGDAHPGLETV